MRRIIVNLDKMEHDWFVEAGCPEKFRDGRRCPSGEDYTCIDCWIKNSDGAVMAVTPRMEAALAAVEGSMQ